MKSIKEFNVTLKGYKFEFWDLFSVPISLLILLFFSGFLAKYFVEQSKAVVNVDEVGEILTGDYLIRFSDQKTIIETTKGKYIVDGVLPITKGNKLVIEKRANGQIKLCDHKIDACLNVIK
jgi:hypothetical protein